MKGTFATIYRIKTIAPTDRKDISQRNNRTNRSHRHIATKQSHDRSQRYITTKQSRPHIAPTDWNEAIAPTDRNGTLATLYRINAFPAQSRGWLHHCSRGNCPTNGREGALGKLQTHGWLPDCSSRLLPDCSSRLAARLQLTDPMTTNDNVNVYVDVKS